jgi:hypothetical protein
VDRIPREVVTRVFHCTSLCRSEDGTVAIGLGNTMDQMVLALPSPVVLWPFEFEPDGLYKVTVERVMRVPGA